MNLWMLKFIDMFSSVINMLWFFASKGLWSTHWWRKCLAKNKISNSDVVKNVYQVKTKSSVVLKRNIGPMCCTVLCFRDKSHRCWKQFRDPICLKVLDWIKVPKMVNLRESMSNGKSNETTQKQPVVMFVSNGPVFIL